MNPQQVYDNYLRVFCVGEAQKEALDSTYKQPHLALMNIVSGYPELKSDLLPLVNNFLDTAVLSTSRNLLGASNFNKSYFSAQSIFIEKINKGLTPIEVQKSYTTVNEHSHNFCKLYISKVIQDLTHNTDETEINNNLRSIIDRCILECKEHTGTIH